MSGLLSMAQCLPFIGQSHVVLLLGRRFYSPANAGVISSCSLYISLMYQLLVERNGQVSTMTYPPMSYERATALRQRYQRDWPWYKYWVTALAA